MYLIPVLLSHSLICHDTVFGEYNKIKFFFDCINTHPKRMIFRLFVNKNIINLANMSEIECQI